MISQPDMHRGTWFSRLRTTALLTALLLPSAVGASQPSPAPTDETALEDPRARVDIDFENGDVRMIVRLLCAAGFARAEVAPEVKGTITIRLHDTPWDDALDVVARDARLVYQRDGKTIYVRNAR